MKPNDSRATTKAVHLANDGEHRVGGLVGIDLGEAGEVGNRWGRSTYAEFERKDLAYRHWREIKGAR
jgi:hypothetical protein